MVELGLLKPGQTDKVLDYFSTYMTHAYPIYDLGYKRKIEAAMRICDPVKNLVTVGRQGLFRYNNMDHSLKMAFLTAKYWGDPNCDRIVRSVATDKEGFEEQSTPPPEVESKRTYSA